MIQALVPGIFLLFQGLQCFAMEAPPRIKRATAVTDRHTWTREQQDIDSKLSVQAMSDFYLDQDKQARRADQLKLMLARHSAPQADVVMHDLQLHKPILFDADTQMTVEEYFQKRWQIAKRGHDILEQESARYMLIAIKDARQKATVVTRDTDLAIEVLKKERLCLLHLASRLFDTQDKGDQKELMIVTGLLNTLLPQRLPSLTRPDLNTPKILENKSKTAVHEYISERYTKAIRQRSYLEALVCSTLLSDDLLALKGLLFKKYINSRLVTAVYEDSQEEVDTLLNCGAEPNYYISTDPHLQRIQGIVKPIFVSPQDSRGAYLDILPPLLVAACWNRPIILTKLLRAQADPNARTSAGWTPLMQAAQRGDFEMVACLMKAGGDVREESGAGTAMDIARQAYDDAVDQVLLLGLLMREHADCERQNDWTPLMTAASKNQVREALRLIQSGDGINYLVLKSESACTVAKKLLEECKQKYMIHLEKYKPVIDLLKSSPAYGHDLAEKLGKLLVAFGWQPFSGRLGQLPSLTQEVLERIKNDENWGRVSVTDAVNREIDKLDDQIYLHLACAEKYRSIFSAS